MQITITIDDERVDEFKEAFLAVYPAPHDIDTGEQLMADNPWIKKRIIDWLKSRYRKGKNKLYRQQQAAIKDPTFIE
jgi:hypothetical protein